MAILVIDASMVHPEAGENVRVKRCAAVFAVP
jgi:hypothetical protein